MKRAPTEDDAGGGGRSSGGESPEGVGAMGKGAAGSGASSGESNGGSSGGVSSGGVASGGDGGMVERPVDRPEDPWECVENNPELRDMLGEELFFNLGKAFLDGVTSLRGIECFDEITEVTFFSDPPEDLSPLALMSSLESLFFGAGAPVDLGQLQDAPRLETLHLSGAGVTDLSPLGQLPSLKELILSEVTNLSGLEQVQSIELLELSRETLPGVDLSQLPLFPRLEHLTLRGAGFENLDALDAQHPTALILERLGLTSLDFLGTIDSLQHLEVREPGFQGTPSPLSLDSFIGLVALSELVLEGTPIATLEPLAQVIRLKSLELIDVPITDLRGIGSHPSLRHLKVQSETVIDVSAFSEGCLLETIDLAWEPIEDPSAFSNCPELTSLQFFGSASDLSFVDGMALRELSFDFIETASLAPLLGMPLEKLSLSLPDEGATDLTPLEDLPLVELSLRGKSVLDLTPLAKINSLDTLKLSLTSVSDLSPLSGLSLDSLDVSSSEVSTLGDLSSIRSLRLYQNQIATLPENLFLDPGSERCIELHVRENPLDEHTTDVVLPKLCQRLAEEYDEEEFIVSWDLDQCGACSFR